MNWKAIGAVSLLTLSVLASSFFFYGQQPTEPKFETMFGAVSSSNLLGCWNLTTDSTDGSGSGNNGTDTSISYAASDAAFVRASNSRIVLPNAAAFKATGSYSVVVWWKTSDGANNPAVFASYSQNTAVAGFNLYIAGSNKVQWVHGKNTGVTNNTDYKALDSATAGSTGSYQMWVFRYTSGGAMEMFLNGNSSADASATPGFDAAYAATSYPVIGNSSQSGTYINPGNQNIKLVAFFGRAITTTEMSDLYASGAGLPCPYSSGATTYYSPIFFSDDTI
ncbi:MAG: hypothetical protein ACK4UO_12980 [Pseudolabrys sp.]